LGVNEDVWKDFLLPGEARPEVVFSFLESALEILLYSLGVLHEHSLDGVLEAV